MNAKLFLSMAVVSLLAACSGGDGSANSSAGSQNTGSSKAAVDLNALTLAELTAKAQAEGEVQSVGMPDTWANWGETWQALTGKYGLKHGDTDMSSAEELALFEAEKDAPTKDIGDVGQSFGPVAVQKDLVLGYKTSYWDEIPAWAKGEDGKWIIAYYGTMSFLINDKKVSNPPKSFADLLNGTYKVTVGDVNAATQAQNAVLSAALANGGSEANLAPGLQFFAQLAKQGRLDLGDTTLARIEKGETEVILLWDFNALNYSETVQKANPNTRFTVVIPSDGAIQSGYATVINKYAPHPHAAALTREFILSDEGQINLAKGFAKPIRKVTLPEEVKSRLLPDEQYVNARPIQDFAAWESSAKKLGAQWQEEVLSEIK
ncbi:MAG: extracellular solute-binding protein [Neisseria sp.]|nr:extracellular solute-binding protein [Neisseria sp.]